MGPAPLKAVLFDFDYTLADSSVGVIDCVRYAQQRMGLDLSGEEEIRRTIGHPVPDIVATLNGEAERGRSDEFGRLFLERADRVMAAGTVVFDAVPGVLEELRARGLACAIASTKYRFRIEEILDREGLRHLVGAVVGAEDVSEHKPDPACLRLALERLGVDAGESLYVGDSLPDAEAARRGGSASWPFSAVPPGLRPSTPTRLSPCWTGSRNCRAGSARSGWRRRPLHV